MTLEYEEAKNRAIIKKHHISIPELATIFDNPFTAPTMDVPDEMHSDTRETGIMLTVGQRPVSM